MKSLLTSFFALVLIPCAIYAQNNNFILRTLGGTPSGSLMGNQNTAFGINALVSVNAPGGVNNTAIGLNSLRSNTNGHSNTAIGTLTLSNNTGGSRNTATGSEALFNNLSSNNTATGYRSLYANTTGFFNTAVGTEALKSNTIGSENTVIGYNALITNITGQQNCAMGASSLRANITGNGNSAIGLSSMEFNTTGTHNSAIGSWALRNNTTGYGNVSMGTATLFSNTLGEFNSGVGFKTLYYNTTGSFNSGLGENALTSNVSGHFNAGVGYHAFYYVTTGDNNTGIGSRTDVSTGNLTNATGLGYSAFVDNSNKVVVGNTAVTVIGGIVNWSVLSDNRYKQNVKAVNNALSFILQLKPVSYQYDYVKIVKEEQTARKNNALEAAKKAELLKGEWTESDIKAEETRLQRQGEEDNKFYEQQLVDAEKNVKRISYGLLAQDAQAAAQKTGYGDFSGIVKPEENGGKYALRYAEFVVPLIGAVQEQQDILKKQEDKISKLESDNQSIKKENEELKARLSRLEEAMNQIVAGKLERNSQKLNVSGAILEQNVPNPFQNVTTIVYYIPENSLSAQIIIQNELGQTIKQSKIQNFGKGELSIQTDGLMSGNYTYSLMVNGQLIVTKKMVLER